MGMGGQIQRNEQSMTAKAADVEAAFIAGAQEMGQEEEAAQALSASNLKSAEEEAVNPGVRFRDAEKKTLSANRARVKKGELDGSKKLMKPIGEIKASAERFGKRNPELKEQTLLLLAERLKECKNLTDLRNVLKLLFPIVEDKTSELGFHFADPMTVDDALDFLEDISLDTKLLAIIKEAKQEHKSRFGTEIEASREVLEKVLEASKNKLGEPKTLRDLYRQITTTKWDSTADLFIELADRYQYKDLRKVMGFLFHSLGADLKVRELRGDKMEIAKLSDLVSTVRSLQAVLGVYNFFRGRTRLIEGQFQRNNLEVPKDLTFDKMAKAFVTLLQDRYPSAEKVLQLANKLGLS